MLQGEVQRSWVWLSAAGAKHVIDLWHDTVTGVRSVAVGLEEVPGSMGSSPFFTTEPHHINFTVGHEQARGMVIIEKAGLFSFRYTCVVNGRPLRATLQELADENEERFNVAILATANAYSTKEKAVTWYELTVTRRSDGARTVVHRRYREFQCLFEQVHAAFKGHHLRSSLPDLPGRQLKLLVDHTDTAFVEERRLLLETAVGKLLSVPHVCAMVPVQVFLGFFDRLKEHSVVFTQRDLGMSITRTVVPEESIIVTRVKEVGQGGQQTRVMVGDTVSKVNGEPVSKYGGFDGVAFQISKGLRPIVIHFLEAVDKNPDHDFLPPGDPIEIPPVHEQLRQRQASLPPSLPSSSQHHSVIPTPSGLPTRVASPTVPMEATPQPTAAAAAAAPLPPSRPKATSNPPPPPSVPRAEARPPGRGPPPRQRPPPPSSSSSFSENDDHIDRLSSKRQEQDPNKLQNILEAALVEEERRGTEGGRGEGLGASSSSLMEQKDPLMDLSTSGVSSSSGSSSSSSSSSSSCRVEKEKEKVAVVTTAGIVTGGGGGGGGGEAVLTPVLVVATPPAAAAVQKEEGVVSLPVAVASAVALEKKEEKKEEKEEKEVVKPPPAPVALEKKEEEKEPAPEEMRPKKKEEEEEEAVVATPVPLAVPSPLLVSSDPPLLIPQAPSAPAPTIRSLSPPLPSIFPSSSLPAPVPTPAATTAATATANKEEKKEAAPTLSPSLPPSTPPVEAAEVASAAIEKAPNSTSSTNGSTTTTTTTTATTQKKEEEVPVVVAGGVRPTSPPPPPPPPQPHPYNHLHPHHPQHNHRRLTPPRIKKAGTEGQEEEGGGGREEGREGEEEIPPSPFEDYM